MKTHSIRRQNGFTLVELLVVITIIAVLAGAGFAAGTAAIQRAKRATALATCMAIESAVNSFYTEYGSMPKDGMTEDTVKLDTTDLDFLKVLLGAEDAGTALNTRGVKFLTVREGKAKKNGIIFSDSGVVEGLYDPWGGPYFIALDGDYDERVTPTPVDKGGKTLNGKRVAVWSNGADAGRSGTGGTAGDNVITW